MTVVDALPSGAYESRHLPGALNLAIEDIASTVQALPDSAAAIVTYSADATCDGGPELCTALIAAGYTNVRNYADGITDWAAAGMPLEPENHVPEPSTCRDDRRRCRRARRDR